MKKIESLGFRVLEICPHKNGFRVCINNGTISVVVCPWYDDDNKISARWVYTKDSVEDITKIAEEDFDGLASAFSLKREFDRFYTNQEFMSEIKEMGIEFIKGKIRGDNQ